MKIRSMCHICEARIAEFSCIKCGRNVCNIHYNNIMGLCIGCSKGKKFRKGGFYI